MCRQYIEIRFVHTKSHTGHSLNTIADELANLASMGIESMWTDDFAFRRLVQPILRRIVNRHVPPFHDISQRASQVRRRGVLTVAPTSQTAALLAASAELGRRGLHPIATSRGLDGLGVPPLIDCLHSLIGHSHAIRLLTPAAVSQRCCRYRSTWRANSTSAVADVP